MALSSYSLEERCFVWEICKVDDFILESPGFSFDGAKWKFELSIVREERSHNIVWIIKMVQVDATKDCYKFLVQVQVESNIAEFHSLIMSSVLFPSKSDQIVLKEEITSLRNRYPNVEWSGSFKFIFMIFNNIKCLVDLKRKGKPQLDILRPDTSWNALPCLESLSMDLQKLMEKDSQHDGEFRCGDCILPIHRLIIGARSEVFRAMLESDMLENRTGSIHIDDMEIPVLEHFHRYLYSGTLSDLTTDLAVKLYKTGDKYAVHSLKRRCSNFLKESLERNNACRILTIADAHNDADLKEGAIVFILEKDIYQEEDEWNTFCNTQPKLANEILNRALKALKSSKQNL